MTAEEKVEKFLVYLEKQLDEKNMSVPELAQKMEVPRSTVYSWLNRSAVMSLEKYYRALKALGIEEKLFTEQNMQNHAES